MIILRNVPLLPHVFVLANKATEMGGGAVRRLNVRHHAVHLSSTTPSCGKEIDYRQ